MAESAFQIQYRDQFIASFAQRQTLLREFVTTEAVIKGNQATFLIGNDNAQVVTRGINGNIPYQANDTTQVTATLVEKHAPVEMTGFNIFASQGNQRAIMQMRSMNAINRDIDDAIITALNTATTTSTVTGAASLAWFTKALSTIERNDVSGDLTAVITPDANRKLLSVSAFTSADFVDAKPLASMPEYKGVRGYYNWAGVRIIVSNRLPGIGTSSATCFLFHRDAIGHAANTGFIDSKIGYDEKQDSSWARTTLYHGGLLLQNSGVIKITHDDTAA